MTLKNKIGVAVIGVGRVGKTHIDSVQVNSDAAYLAAVVDANETLAKSTAEQFSTKFYTSVASALKDPAIQAVVICLPHHLHKPVALQAMTAGRHVLVEKPWATNLADGKEMLAQAREKKVTLMAGQDLRFLATMQEAKKRLIKGEIGRPFNALFIMSEIFTLTLTPGKFTAPSWWREVKKTGGLTFTMLGSHTVDIILWMFEGKKPIRVYAEAENINKEFEGMDEVLLTIRFDDGAIATNYLSINTRPAKNEYLIVGTEGRMVATLEGAHDVKKLIGVFGSELFVRDKLVVSSPQVPHNFALEMKEFLSAINEKREPMVKHAEMLTQIAILDAAQKSAATHQPVSL